MLKRLIPAAFARALRDAVRRASPAHRAFYPHQPGAESYVVPKTPESAEYHPSSPLPVPPPERRLYGDSTEGWLALGEDNVRVMRELLREHGASIEEAGRILDLGCREGRMIRWLADLADTCEIWGTDVSATDILWCKQHLSPPFHFATTTLFPHLPFEDHYFGLVYAGSVFTHIDDLADAWFQELRRVLRPGGMLYITIHDRHTASLVGQWDHPQLNAFAQNAEFQRYARSDFGMFTLGRHDTSQVFYDVAYLQKSLEPFFATQAVVQEAYTYQTAVLLERV